MNFISSGDFHIADTYVINHNSPNLVHLVPKKAGAFKLLIQKASIELNDEILEMEIILYDPSASNIIS